MTLEDLEEILELGNHDANSSWFEPDFINSLYTQLSIKGTLSAKQITAAENVKAKLEAAIERMES